MESLQENYTVVLGIIMILFDVIILLGACKEIDGL